PDSLVIAEYEMFVFTSVIVTVTPGSASPDESTMLPSSAPFTACASTTCAHVRTSAAADTLLTSVRPRRRSMSHPPYRQPTSNERSPCERRTWTPRKSRKRFGFVFVFFAFFVLRGSRRTILTVWSHPTAAVPEFGYCGRPP